MATNIPPHNLGEVINGVQALIDNPEITIDELMQYIPAPDFPTGGLIMGRMGVRQAYTTGRGGIIIRAKTEIEEFNNRQHIVVTELPYQVNKEELIKKIANLVKEKRIEGISDVKEESDRTGMRIVIDIKRDAQAQVVLNTLYKHTELQVSGGIIFLALVNNEPKILNLKEMLSYYLEHQIEVVTRRTKFDLERAEERAHIVEGLLKALANIDRVVEIIKNSRDNVDALHQLMEEFILSEKQANAILEMKLRRLTGLEVETLQSEMVDLTSRIADFRDILANPARVTAIIKEELEEIKQKYGDERRTEICVNYDEINIADLIEREDVIVSMTHYGYVKRLPVGEYKAQHRGGTGVTAHKPKEEDFVENMFVTCTHDDLLFFTSKGRVYSIKAYEIPEADRTARGRAIVNLLQLTPDERVTAVIRKPEDFDGEGYLLMATRHGLIKKTAMSEFDSIRKVGKIAIVLNEGDELIAVDRIKDGDDILLASTRGKCIRFNQDDVRAMGRVSSGVRSIKMEEEDDYVVDMAIIEKDSTKQVLTVTSKGYGKRSDIDEYRQQTRGGKGSKAGNFNEQTGTVVNLKLVSEDEDVMIIADNGIVIRLPANEISCISRATKGVRIMKLKGEGSVVCVAVVEREEESGQNEPGNAEISAETAKTASPDNSDEQ